MQFREHRLAAMIILAVIAVSAQKKPIDVAIVVDNSPLDQKAWHQQPEFTWMKATTIVAIIEGLQKEPSFDCRFAVFILGKEGPTNPTTILSFSESNIDHHEIYSKIAGPISSANKNYPYDYMDLVRVINNMRKNFIERNPGNRPEAIDLLIWTVNYESIREDESIRAKAFYELANENIEVLIIFELRWLRYSDRLVHGMVTSVQKTPPDIQPLGGYEYDSIYGDSKVVAKENVPKWIKELLGFCDSAIGQGQCYFDGPNNCVQKPSIEIPKRIVKYCTTSQMTRRCPQGLRECTRLCNVVNDRLDVKPCDAQCDQRGWIRYRTGRAKTDPLYQHCSWEEDKEACQGPPCPKPPTTTTTTTKKTTTTTTTSKRTTTTTEKTTSTTTPKQTTTTTKEGTKSTTSLITRKPEPPTKGPRPGPGPTKAPKPGPDTETEEPPPTDSGNGPATGTPKKSKPEDAVNSSLTIGVGEIVMLVLGVLGTLAAIILIVVLIVLAVRKKRRRERGHRSPPDRGRDSRYSMDRTGTSHVRSIDQSRPDYRTRQTRGTDRTRDGHGGNRTVDTVDHNRSDYQTMQRRSFDKTKSGRGGSKGRTSGKDGGKQRKSNNRSDEGHRKTPQPRSSGDRHGGRRR